MSPVATDHVVVEMVTSEIGEPNPSATQGWLSWLIAPWKLTLTWVIVRLSMFTTIFSRSKSPAPDPESGLVCEDPQRGNSEANVVVIFPPPLSIAYSGAPRPSRFVEHLAEHPCFAPTPPMCDSTAPTGHGGSNLLAPKQGQGQGEHDVISETPVLEPQAEHPGLAEIPSAVGPIEVVLASSERSSVGTDLLEVAAPSAPRPSRFIEHLDEHPRFKEASRSIEGVITAASYESSGSLVLDQVAEIEHGVTSRPETKPCKLGKACAHSGAPHQHVLPAGPVPVPQAAGAVVLVVPKEPRYSTNPDYPTDVSSHPLSGERARVRMHDQAASQIRMPTLRSFRSRSSIDITGAMFRNICATDCQAGPSNSSVRFSYTHPKRSSAHYESYKLGVAPGMKEWMEQVGNGAAIDSLVLLQPPSPESPGPLTPTSELTGVIGVEEDERLKDEFAEAVLGYGLQSKTGGDGAAAL
ncbi:hypothetical protein FRC12_000306 [Ceratobasidium sp. 428]|nr:hypothetical protein FRC12_000306 [Ceratobasidium sp. 428]